MSNNNVRENVGFLAILKSIYSLIYLGQYILLTMFVANVPVYLLFLAFGVEGILVSHPWIVFILWVIGMVIVTKLNTNTTINWIFIALFSVGWGWKTFDAGYGLGIIITVFIGSLIVNILGNFDSIQEEYERDSNAIN